MATLSAGDLVNLRGPTVHRSTPYLSVFQPATLLTALVNNGAIARGARTVAFDTGTGIGFATIEAGQVLEVDTATGTEFVRVKSISGTQVSGSIVVDENSIVWADNQVLRIKHFYLIVPVPPRITSGVFYKFFDLVYSNQNSLQSPVAVTQGHLVGTLSAGSGSVAFTISGASSYAIASGATISSYAWSCVHNGGGTTGITITSSTSATTTLTITVAGQYWLKLIVTDSNGKTQSTWRGVWVYDSSTLPYKDFTVTPPTGDWQQGGWRCSVQATGDVTLADFPDMTLCVLWYENKFDNTPGYVNLWGSTTGQNIIMAGYLRTDSDNDNFDKGTGVITFDITTPEAVIDTITLLGTVSLNYTAAPATWYQLANMTVGRAVHHLLKWHTWVFETCDVLGLTDNTLKVKNIDLTEDSVLQMINSLAYGRGIFAKLVSSRLGRLHFVVDSQMLNTAARAALDTTCSITVADISGTVDVVRQAESMLGTAELDGFSFDGTTGTPFISICPGYRENSISYGFPKFRGTGTQKTSGQVLIDQTDSNEKVGRLLAVANNNPREFRFNCRGNYLGAFDIVPSAGWYIWALANVDLKRELALNGKKLVCRNVTHSINVETGLIQTSVVLESEALGPDGIQGNYPVGYPPPVLRIPNWTPPVTHVTATYAYAAGGQSGAAYVAIADRLTFATGATAAYATGDLTQDRAFHGALSDTMTYGYWAGGAQVFGDPTETTSTERTTLATGVAAAHTATLSDQKGVFYGLSDYTTNGYFPGGIINSATETDNTDKVTFSTGVISASVVSDLSAARYNAPALSDKVTYGYTGGGSEASGYVATADRLTFATGVTAANAGSDLSTARENAGPVSDNVTYGYWGGGFGGANSAVTDRITFATGVTAANVVSDLAAAKIPRGTASDATTFGYFIDINTGTSDKITFATGVTAANAASDLSDNRVGLASFSDGAV